MPKKQKQYTYDSNGQKRKLCPSIPVEGSRIIHSDPRELAAMDAESIRKSEVQRQNDLETMLWSKTHGCG